ncbi:IMPACT family protein [Halanaerobium salsuginis]|jgi:uncharacterized YigZ family protein|uniref:Uncharacterized protein, YigZ family n=1 Tax=Halanaerobium salsuginis TaxID=29563 RepID=A0A1I4GBY5_9FIRM|nr:YigZ family protein [Halanaerobium salsuginis]SFL27020.1 uncharacterized protein, YigZ family [Halanaerobium salsuginis]
MSEIKKKPANNFETRHNVKDSKFLASIFAVQNRNEAEARINEIKSKYSDATHNVSAFRVESKQKNNSVVEYFDDDGEPAGSSGPPILEAIKGADLINTVIIVTRYFGGTKLGIGGLIRAYGDSARLAIEAAGITILKKYDILEIEVEFDKIGIVMGQLEAFQAEIKNTDYNNAGLRVTAIIKTDISAKLAKILREKTAGAVEIKIKTSFYR